MNNAATHGEYSLESVGGNSDGRLTQSYPNYSPSAHQSYSDKSGYYNYHRPYDKLEHSGDLDKILGHRILPDLPRSEPERRNRSTSPRLSKSLDDRRMFNALKRDDQVTEPGRNFPGLSSSYDHLNFNYHSPYYKSRSTSAQLGGSKSLSPTQQGRLNGREIRETWCPTDYCGYVETRGPTHGYLGHIERVDKYNNFFFGGQQSKSCDNLLLPDLPKPENKGYKLNAPYATTDKPPTQFQKSYFIRDPQNQVDTRPKAPIESFFFDQYKPSATTTNTKDPLLYSTSKGDQTPPLIEKEIFPFLETKLGEDQDNYERFFKSDGGSNRDKFDPFDFDPYKPQAKQTDERKPPIDFDAWNKQRSLAKEEMARRCNIPVRNKPPLSEVKPIHGTEKLIPKCQVQPSAQPYHTSMEAEYVPRSTVIPLQENDDSDNKALSNSKKNDPSKEKGIKPATTHGKKPHHEQHHVTFKDTKLTKNEKLAAEQKRKEKSSEEKTKPLATAVNSNTMNNAYTPSLDNGEPYVENAFQNTPNKLINGGIVPYNFFPIICSSHLPKKVTLPFDMKDLSKQDTPSAPRSKSKSPERTTPIVDVNGDKKKRSRSHSPKVEPKEDTGSDEKRPRTGTLEAKPILTTSDTKDIPDAIIPKTATTKKKIPKKKKKAGTTTSQGTHLAAPTQKKSRVRSPRIVLRESKVKSVPMVMNRNYAFDENKEDETQVKCCNNVEPPTIKLDSSGNLSSHDERIVFSGGLEFNSPKRTNNQQQKIKRKQKTKKTTVKGGKLKTKSKAPTKTKQQRQQTDDITAEEEIQDIVNANNKRIAELQFFENITQVENNTKTLEEDLKEIVRIKEQERQLELQYILKSRQQHQHNELPPRAAPQASLMPTVKISSYENKSDDQRITDFGRENRGQSKTDLMNLEGSTSMSEQKLDTTNMSEQEIIDLITLEIDQHEKKNKVFAVPNPVCGYSAQKKSNTLAYESTPSAITEADIPITTCYLGDTTSQLNAKSVDGVDDGVFGVPHLTRHEKTTKKELEKNIKNNVIVATPIIKRGDQPPPSYDLFTKDRNCSSLRERFENNTEKCMFPSLPNPLSSTKITTRNPGFRMPRRSKDDSYDSFEHHEKYFGILDDNGDLRSNKQLLDTSNSTNYKRVLLNKYDTPQRTRNKKQRKNERLQRDLEEVRHQRRASCPATIGVREGFFSFSDDAYSSDANTIDSIDELKSKYVEHINITITLKGRGPF